MCPRTSLTNTTPSSAFAWAHITHQYIIICSGCVAGCVLAPYSSLDPSNVEKLLKINHNKSASRGEDICLTLSENTNFPNHFSYVFTSSSTWPAAPATHSSLCADVYSSLVYQLHRLTFSRPCSASQDGRTTGRMERTSPQRRIKLIPQSLLDFFFYSCLPTLKTAKSPLDTVQ